MSIGITDIRQGGMGPASEMNTELLLRELDAVIQHQLTVVEEDLNRTEEVIRAFHDHWMVLLNSLELHSRLRGEDHPAWDRLSEEIPFPNLLIRWLEEREVKRRHPSRAVKEAKKVSAASTPTRIEQIMDILAEQGEPMDTSDIVEALLAQGELHDVKDPRAAISAALSRGARQGLLERIDRGVYGLSKWAED